MAVCPLATQLSSCARASTASASATTRAETTTRRRSRDRRRDATRVDVTTDAIIERLPVRLRRSSMRLASRIGRLVDDVPNERTNARARGVRSKRLSRPVDGLRRRLRTETHPAADVSSVSTMHTVYPYELHGKTDDRHIRRAFVSIVCSRTVDRRYRENTHTRTERRDPTRPRRRSVVRRRARRSPSIGLILIGGLSCPSPIDES